GVSSPADGLKINVDTGGHIDWQMVFLGRYEPHLAGIFASLGGAGSVVADIGANVGAHTLPMARHVGTEGRVLAFEPNPTVCRKPGTPHDLVDVLVRPFDSVIESLSLDRLDLIKIDIQGFEQRVLQGMAGVLRRFSPAIVFQYEVWTWSLSGSHWSVVESLFFGGGYRLWRIGQAGNRARLAEL